MRIGVDAGCLGIKDERLKVGVYQVALNLLKEISKIDSKNTYLLYSFYPINKEIMRELGGNMKNIVITPTRGWMKIWLPIQIAKDKIDLFLGLNQAFPKRLTFTKNYTKIGLVYDLAYEIYPKFYPDSYTKLTRQTKYLVNKSDKIVSISEKTKEDLINKFPNIKGKIIVAYPGTNVRIKNQELRIKNDKYFLFVGALKRSKNIPTLIKAFSEFVKTNKDYKLVIAGGDKWIDPEIKQTLEELNKNIQEKIVFKGFVKDNDLVNLYKNATAFVSPSWYEGFGLTFLEAMSYGCPVIGSDKGSIPEVIGNAGILVDPSDVEGLTGAMNEMIKAQSRNKFIKRGLNQAKKFTWEKFAKEVYKIVKQYER